MKIEKKDLKKALEVVKPGLSNNEINLEQSTSFAFMNDRVVTYNDEISVSHPVKNLNLRGAVHANELYALLNKFKQDTLELEVSDTEITITCGRAKAGLTLEKEIKLPLEEIGDMGDFYPLPDKFTEFMKMAVGACGTDESKPKLTCVNVDESGKIQSSDGYRIMQCEVDPMPVPTFLLPAKSASKILNLELTEIASGSGWVHFKTSEGSIVSCRIWGDTYVAVESHLKIKGTELSLPKTLDEVLERASIFSKRDHFLDETVTVELNNNRIRIQSDSDFGWYEEECNMKYKGDAIAFMITPSLFKNIINRSQTCILGKKAIKFFEKDWQYIGMFRNKE